MKKQNGITLIALVVTIVLLLIIAGIGLNTVFGDEGIFTKARIADFKNELGIVSDAVKLELIQFKTIKLADHLEQSPIDYLKEKNYIDANNIVQVKNITATELKIGNGTLETGDIFQIDVENKKLVYINENKESSDLASLGELK